MKLICTSNNAFEDQLTEGFQYAAVETSNNSVRIVNDKGEMRWYGAAKFRVDQCANYQAA